MKKINFKNGGIQMSAILYFPKGFTEDKKYPAIVVTHPAGGVKEQTSGLYASRLADEGFVTLAFDASYQGESSGEPRQLENPYARVEDISAAIDYLTTLPYIDRDRIGSLGICTGAGYSTHAALNDRRIKALGTVSCANYGAILRKGWHGTETIVGAFKALDAAANARTSEAAGGQVSLFPIVPLKREEAPNADLAEATDYYRTSRGMRASAPGMATTRSLAQLATYDAFHGIETFLTQPLMVVAGSKAGTLWMSKDLHKRAASKNKHLHIVKGGTHVGMFDDPKLLTEAVSVLGPFFKETLSKAVKPSKEAVM